MQPSPDFIAVERKGNVVRNVLFLCLIIVGIGAFGLHSTGSFEIVKKQITRVEVPSDVRGGDVVVVFEKEHIPTPKKIDDALVEADFFTAASVMVKDMKSGTVLLSKNEYEKRPIASITKLMSAITLLDFTMDWNTTTIAATDELFDTFFQKGFEYYPLDMWNASLIGSSNRGVVSLVDMLHIGRERFVDLMNNNAWAIGMSDAAFVDPTGLDAGNVASASDVVLLLDEALKRKEIKETLLKNEYKLATVQGEHSRHIWNTNWLQIGWIPHDFFELAGGKTGFIPESGYNFTAQIKHPDGHVLSVVVLGAEDNEARFTEARDAVEWVLEHYVWE